MAKPKYDVFLSHATLDKPVVEELARLLVAKGLCPWLDKWDLVPGEPWLPAIEEALEICPACAVCIGPRGFGAWQTEEMRGVQLQVSKNRRVIPVLLPGAERGERSALPLFLQGRTWVDFYGRLDDDRVLQRLVAGIRGERPGPAPGEAVAQGACPYRGLEYFDIDDSLFFHGRETLTGWLLAKLRPTRLGNRFLAIVGPSGSGKSSLARAGLLGALKNGEIPGSQEWPLTICKPGPQPLESLAVALRPTDPPAEIENLMRLLATNPRMLHLTTRLALNNAPEDRRFVLLVDQFEEVFTLCADETQRRALIDNLLHAAREEGGRTAVVLTLRADFFHDCAAYPALASAISDRVELVGAMTDEDLRQCIEEPARLAGYQLADGLTDLLVKDISGQPGGLPLLEHALLQIWEKRDGLQLTTHAYRAIEGVTGALQRHAEEVFSTFNPAQREACPRIFLRLVQVDEERGATKRRLGITELVSRLEPEDYRRAETFAIRELIRERLLTTSGEERPTVEIAHEAILSHWERLRQWIEQDWEALRTRRRLDEAVAEWLGNGRDSSFLYRGVRLAQARAWNNQHSGELEEETEQFLAESTAAEEYEHQQELAQSKKLEEAQRQRAEEQRLRADAERQRADEQQLRAEAERQRADEQRLRGDAEHQQVEERARANRRLRKWNIAFGAAGVLAVAAATTALYLRHIAVQQRSIAEAENLAATSVRQSQRDPALGLLLSIKAVRLADFGGQTHLPSAEEALRSNLSIFRGSPLPTGKVRTAAVSSDRRWLAVAGSDGSISLWDLGGSGPVRKASLLDNSAGSSTELIAVSTGGKWLLIADSDDSHLLQLNAKWTVESDLPLKGEDWLFGSDPFSPNGRWLVTRQEGAFLLRTLTAPPRIVATLKIQPEAFALSPDGQWLAMLESKSLAVWDLTMPGPNPRFRIPGSGKLLTFSSDSQWVVAAEPGRAGAVQAWRVSPSTEMASPIRFALSSCTWSESVAPNTQDPLLFSRIPNLASCFMLVGMGSIKVRLNNDTFTAAAVDSQSKRFAAGSSAGSISIGNLAPGSVSPWTGIFQSGPVWLLSFQGSRLISQGGGDPPRVLEVLPGPDVAGVEPLRFSSVPGTMVISPQGWRLSLDPATRNATLWGTRGPQTVPAAEQASQPWIFSPDGHFLAAAGLDGRPLAWRIKKDGAVESPIFFSTQYHHAAPATALAFSPDLHWLASGDQNGEARLWSLQNTNAEPRPLTNSEGGVAALAFRSDGRLIATAARNDGVRLRDLNEDGPALADRPETPADRLGSHEIGLGLAAALTFLKDGRLALSGSSDRVKLWQSGHEIFLSSRALSVFTLTTNLQGNRLASVSSKGAVQIWSLEDKGPSQDPVLLPGSFQALAFTPDGNGLWTVDKVGRLQRWELRTDKLLGTACRAVGRNLTEPEWRKYIPYEPYQGREPCPEFPKAFD